MKVCFICCEYPPALHGGIGSVIQTSARALVRNGHNVRVIGVYPPTENTPAYEEDQGVKVWRLRGSQGRMSWVSARYELFQTVEAWAKQGLIDVIEVPDWEGFASLWPALPVPVVVRLHGSVTYFGAEMKTSVRRTVSWLESRSFHRADRISSCSKYTAVKTNEIFGEHRNPTTVLYNAVSPSMATVQHPRERNSVIYAGTLTRKKGIIQLVGAWPDVWAANPNAELHIYGKDAGTEGRMPMVPYLKSLLPEAALKSVHFHGHVAVSQLRSIYQRCRMAAFPSYAEAFAMAPMEAMAEGCPVIVSNRSSGPELIRPGHDGLLVDPDNKAEISEAILKLLSDDSLAARVGATGRQTIEDRFSSHCVTHELVAFYSSCVGSFRGNGVPV